MSAVEHLIHPLSLRVYDNPRFFLEPQPDILCGYCLLPCDIGPPVPIHMKDTDLNRGSIVLRKPQPEYIPSETSDTTDINPSSSSTLNTISQNVVPSPAVDMHKLYCSLECMYAVAQTDDLQHVNHVLSKVYQKGLAPCLVLRRALNYATLDHLGGPLTRQEFREFNATGSIDKYKHLVYYHPTDEDPTNLTTQRLRVNKALETKEMMPYYSIQQRAWNYDDPFWKQPISQSDPAKYHHLCCWNDGYPLLDTDAIPLPCILRYDTKQQKVEAWKGIFCGLACINSFLIRTHLQRQKIMMDWNREFYSHHLGNERLYSESRTPSRRLLQKFGGTMDIHLFRSLTPSRSQLEKIPYFVREAPFRSFGNTFGILRPDNKTYQLIYGEHKVSVLDFMHKDRLTHKFKLDGDEFQQGSIHFKRREHYGTHTQCVEERKDEVGPCPIHYSLLTMEEFQERQSDTKVAVELIKSSLDKQQQSQVEMVAI